MTPESGADRFFFSIGSMVTIASYLLSSISDDGLGPARNIVQRLNCSRLLRSNGMKVVEDASIVVGQIHDPSFDVGNTQA